jgi:DNA-binding Lrp family transcriptional regulator
MEDFEFDSKFNEKYSMLVKRMTRLLSENSRISVTQMAKTLGVSRQTVKNKLKKMEGELGVKYTIEIDDVTLGLNSPHLILVKFTEKPNYGDIAKMLEDSHVPQLVATVEGSYNMLIYANAENQNEYVYWDRTTRILLSKYKAIWQPSDLAFMHLGFFPLRNALIERMKIPKDSKAMLLLLNENSRMSFSEMSRRLGVRSNTLAYRFNKLLKMGYIKRFTMVMQNPENVSMITLFGKYIIADRFEEDSMGMRKEVTFLDDKTPLINRCVSSAQLIGSYDFFFAGVYDNYTIGYTHLIKYYKARFKRHKVKTMYGAINKIILGHFPTRNIDVRKEFKMIRWMPGTEPKIENQVL